jgi:hypothetical protein
MMFEEPGFPTLIHGRGGVMKRFALLTGLVLLSMFVWLGNANAGFGIRVSGPATHVSLDQFNDYVDIVNSEELVGLPYSMNNLDWVAEFSGEVMYNALPMLDIGLGAGIIMGTSELAIAAGLENWTEKHKLRSYPFTATGYFRPAWPLGPFKPIIYGGAGIYYTKWSFSMAYMGSGDDYSYEWELSKWGFGLHGGAGFEISILPKLSVDVGVKARWANFKGFEGTGPDPEAEGEEVDVLLGSGYREGSPWFGPIAVDEADDFDEGEIDLTGYSIVVGIKVMF